MKFDAGFQFDVQSGGTLNVNGTAGNHVVMTSSTDNNIGTGNTALLIDWEGVNFNAGSGGTINFLDIWYARDGIDLVNVTSNPVFTNLSVNYCQDGLRINSSTGMSLTFNNLALSENSSNHMVLEGNGSLSTTFTESTVNGLSITDIPGNGADATNGIFISNTDVNNIVSGFTIDGTSNPIRYASSGSNITDNNIIRNSTGVGINHTSNGNPLIRNNIIVNSASSGMSISGNGNIFGNLIRQNRRHSGGGIFISGSNATIENNLIIENESTSNTSNSGGSGIYVTGNSSPTIINNTIANNFSADNGGFEGAGINVESSGGTVTLRDNIIFGNTDNTGANDIYDDVGRITVSGTNLIGTINSNAGLNLYTGVGDVAANDPLFVQGWYLSSNNEGPISPAVDAGSNNASAILPLPLNTLTSRTDGGLDGIADGAIVNVGYHYAGAFVAANAVNSTATSNPASPVITVAATPVVITITPRDGASNVIGPGLEVHAIVASNVANPSTGTQGTTGTNSTMTSVRDLGDGSYEVTFTPDSGSANSENISFSVNGVTLNATVSVTWTL